MWMTLLEKMLTSRKFVVLATTLIIKLLGPVSAKWGIDLGGVEQALNEWMPAIIAWILGQSTVDAVKANKLPEPPASADGVPGVK